MSHFYADIEGHRGTATRQGTAKSGIEGHIRGWQVGARVIVDAYGPDGQDRVRVYRTGGSHNPSGELIAEFTKDGAPKFFK